MDSSQRLNLPPPFDRPGLVVFHSTYVPAHAPVAMQLRQVGIPYIVCPHGGLTRRYHATTRWNKRLVNLIFFNYVVPNAAALHYLSDGEVEASGRWKRPNFVVGTGGDAPEDTVAPPEARTRTAPPRHDWPTVARHSVDQYRRFAA